MDAKKLIAIISHDAGGANILAALANKYNGSFAWHFILAGPAVRVFSSYPQLERMTVPHGSMSGDLFGRGAFDLMVTGTGWQTNHELDGIRFAKERGIPVLAYLDHWTNYRERFGTPTNWQSNLPDFVAVGDAYAYEKAMLEGFPKAKLTCVENPYLESFLQKQDAIREASSVATTKTLLFLSEPFRPTFHASGDSQGAAHTGIEYEALQQLLNLLLNSKALDGYTLRIRLHPSESKDKYTDLLRKILGDQDPLASRVEVHDPFLCSLEEDCCGAEFVIGISSMALLVSAALGRKTFSLNPRGIVTGLPHPEVVQCADEESLATQLFGQYDIGLGIDLKLYKTPFDLEINRLIG